MSAVIGCSTTIKKTFWLDQCAMIAIKWANIFGRMLLRRLVYHKNFISNSILYNKNNG